MRKKKKVTLRANNFVEEAKSCFRPEKKKVCGYNGMIDNDQYKKELKLLESGVDLLEESRRHG